MPRYVNKLEKELVGKGLFKDASRILAEGGAKVYSTMTEFNSDGGAASYGTGPVWIGENQYYSNGSLLYPINVKSNKNAIIVGDSLMALANQIYAKTDSGFNILISNGIATITRNSHVLWEGSPITFSATNDVALDGKNFLVKTRIDANNFTVDVPGAVDAIYNSSTISSVAIHVLSQHGSGNWAILANAMTGGNLTFVTPLAQSGQRIDQINLVLYSRLESAGFPGVVFYTCGVNDVAQGATLSQIQARLTESYQICNQTGAIFVITTLTPQTGASTAIRDIIFAINNWLRSRDWPNFYVVDWSQLVSDNVTVGWSNIPGTNQTIAADSLHPSAYGHLIAAKEAINILPYNIFQLNPKKNIINSVADDVGKLLYIENWISGKSAASGIYTGNVPTGWSAANDVGVTAATIDVVGSDSAIIPPIFAKNGNMVKLSVVTATSGAARIEKTVGIDASIFNALVDSATPWIEIQFDVTLYNINAMQGLYAGLQLYDTAHGAFQLLAQTNNERKLSGTNDTFDDWQTTANSGISLTLRSPRTKLTHTIGSGAFCRPYIKLNSGVSGMTGTALIGTIKIIAFKTQFD